MWKATPDGRAFDVPDGGAPNGVRQPTRPSRGRKGNLPVERRELFIHASMVAAARLQKEGRKPTPLRILRALRSDPGYHRLTNEIESAYGDDAVRAFIRTGVTSIPVRATVAQPIPKKTKAWVRARLGQIGFERLVPEFGDSTIDALIKRARTEGEGANYTPDELRVLWILRERELVPYEAVDPVWYRKYLPKMDQTW